MCTNLLKNYKSKTNIYLLQNSTYRIKPIWKMSSKLKDSVKRVADGNVEEHMSCSTEFTEATWTLFIASGQLLPFLVVRVSSTTVPRASIVERPSEIWIQWVVSNFYRREIVVRGETTRNLFVLTRIPAAIKR